MCGMSIASVKQPLMNGVAVVHRISCTLSSLGMAEEVRPDTIAYAVDTRLHYLST
jgi:hypothetical protein